MSVKPAALVVFVACFALVTGMGLWASRWRRPASLDHLNEWGLGGRGFGPWVVWFLIGGDFYTAYTVIAVPALVFASGAYGFFALPYAILVYPVMYVVMPRLWSVAAACGAVTAADIVQDRHGSRALSLAVAITGIVATMPYIALQLVGMQVVIRALVLTGELPLIAAFLILAVYTWSAGLRAPALIAFVKDIMIYAVVIAAVALIPARLGGYGAVFHAADAAFRAAGKPATGILLAPAQMLPFATLALGSAFAAFMYPHTLTGMLAADGPETLRRNAVALPAYTLLLGLIALLGYMAIAAGVHPHTPTDVVPALFGALFPAWFAGFAYGAIAIAALVPAAVMSIGASTLFSRNVWRAFAHPDATPAQEARVAKIASLVVKLGALLAILVLPTQYAIDLQLLGGVWILQTAPALALGVFTNRLRATGLLAGWATGMVLGSALVAIDGLKPVHHLHIAGVDWGVYTGLLALVANLAVAAALSIRPRGR